MPVDDSVNQASGSENFLLQWDVSERRERAPGLGKDDDVVTFEPCFFFNITDQTGSFA